MIKFAIVFLFILMMGFGCGKKASMKNQASGSGSIERPTPNQGKIKVISLGVSGDFSILAYASITSRPPSFIEAKVGLMPGTRDQIVLDPSEVSGGSFNIMGSDDDTDPMNLLSNAKVDMVTAYHFAKGLKADEEKSGIYNGILDEKVLTPGIYEWNHGLEINKDFTLVGEESDIFIFKVHGHLNLGHSVRMNLGEGVKAKNILWQVAGSVVLWPESQFYGTIISQPSIELKNNAVLTGRAFCKNGFVNLTHATIKKP